jgi:hypothetical protein
MVCLVKIENVCIYSFPEEDPVQFKLSERRRGSFNGIDYT